MHVQARGDTVTALSLIAAFREHSTTRLYRLPKRFLIAFITHWFLVIRALYRNRFAE